MGKWEAFEARNRMILRKFMGLIQMENINADLKT
jgi:hypothetical protein